MTRRHLSTKARTAIFVASGGICHLCGGKITVGQAWEIEHVIPLAQGGSDEPDNMRPAHARCHKAKTADDLGNIARAKRREAKHIGAKAPSRRPLPFGKRSPWKMKLDGRIVPR